MNNYGTPISLDKVIELAKEHKELKSKLSISVKSEVVLSGNQELLGKLGEFTNEQFNAFVFSKEAIERFFDGREQKADYLLILFGAHSKTEEVGGDIFNAGSSTVITLGCSMNSEGEFEPINDPNPGTEYPPKTKIELESKIDLVQNKISFVVI